MEIIGAATGGDALTNDQIIDLYPAAIQQLVAAAADNFYDSERQILLNKARLQWMFVRGEHFNAPGFMVTPYGTIADYVPFDFSEGAEETGPDVKLCPPINKIGGDLYKFKAVMGQNAPRVKAAPDDAKDPDCVCVAENADVQARDLWQKQDIDAKWDLIAFHQYTTGPAFIHGVWNCDVARYGQTMEPKIDIEIGPDGMPLPKVIQQVPYPNGDAEAEIYSILEVSVPWQAKTMNECDWLKLEVMRSKWQLLERYKGTNGKPGRLEKYRDGSPDDNGLTSASALAAEVQDAVSTPSGVGCAIKPNEWRHAEYWLKPQLFQSISEEDIRQVFESHFAHGLYIAQVANITVDICDEDKCEAWVVCKVGRETKINERPLCADAVPLQRVFNDLWGMSIETVLRGITQTIVDSQLFDRQAMNTNEAVPAEIIPTALPVDGDISKRIFQIQPARLSDQVPVLIAALIETWNDIVGIKPEIAGGGQPTQTYREAKQRRDQALLVLAPQAKCMREAAAATATMLVKLRAKYGAGTVKASRKTAYGKGTDIADMAQLKADGWHMEADDNFPMTLADRRDAVFSMLKDFPPEVQQALTIMDPMNIEQIFELLQVPGFESAIREQVEKNLTDIDQLLNAQPITTPDPVTGQPGPPLPSLPPDPYENHMVACGVFSKWMVSKVGQEAKANQPQGFANIEVRWKAQMALANPVPPLPPPIKPSLAISAKLEDFPAYAPTIMADSGIQVPNGPTAAPQPPMAPGGMPSPSPIGGGPPVPTQQSSPIPPLTPPPNGAPPMQAVQ